MCIDRVIEIRFSFSKFLSTNSQKTLTYIKMNLIHYFDDTRLKSMKLSDFNKHIIYTIFIYVERMIYETISVHTIHDQLHSVIRLISIWSSDSYTACLKIRFDFETI